MRKYIPILLTVVLAVTIILRMATGVFATELCVVRRLLALGRAGRLGLLTEYLTDYIC